MGLRPRRNEGGTANKKHIITDNPDTHDSELTFHGRPRKRKYAKNRAKRDIVRYKMQDEQRKEAQIKLLSFAPEFTSIYTISYYHQGSKFIYMDVLALHDNRIYKITKLMCYILDSIFLKSQKGERSFHKHDLFRVKKTLSPEDRYYRYHVDLEEQTIKELSMVLFGYEDGYIWHSMHDLYSFDIKKPEVKKSYKVEKKVAEPTKNFRLR